MTLAALSAPQTGVSTSTRVREVDLAKVSPEFVCQWRKLESRAIEGNAFRSSSLVLPALKLIENSSSRPFAVAVESDEGELIGLGVFEECRSSRQLPLRHLRSWQSDYSLFDGLLVDRSKTHEALVALFRFVGEDSRWNGISFRNRSADSQLARVLDRAAAETGAAWHEDWNAARAIVPIAEVPDDVLTTLYSKSRRKTLKQSLRRLETRGGVSYSLVSPGPGETRSVYEFLRLESLGWKGTQGTAMAADARHAQFCRKLVSGFAEGSRAVFGELKVDGRIVASTLNLISGNTLFAVKIGWDPDFADCSPGTLSELFLLQHCHELTGITHVDSCAKPDSYVEKIWPWRTTLTTGLYTTSTTADLTASALGRLKRFKRQWK